MDRSRRNVVVAVLACEALALASLGSAQERITAWRTTLPLPVATPVVDAIEHRGHIVAFAPDAGRTFVGDLDATTGEVLAWRETLPIPRFVSHVAAGVTVVGDHVIVPGWPSSAVGALAPDGSILSWQPGPSTNTAATGARAVALDGSRLYAVGGGAPFVVFNSVETATFEHGTLSPWQTLAPLPILMSDGLAIVHGGNLYAFGGHGSTPGGDLSHAREVFRAPILASGAIGSWSLAGMLLEARTNGDLLRFGETIHIVAGGVNSYMTASVESALGDDLGNTSRHVFSAPLPTVLNEHAAVVVGRFGYVLGGNHRAFGGGAQAAVYVAELAAANSPPVAEAGDDQVVAAGPGCVAAVELDGSGSSDPDGDVLSFDWQGPGGPFAGEMVTLVLPPGEHTFTLSIADGRGGFDDDEVVVRVEDRAAPAIDAVAPAPSRLWPPNHRLRPVAVSARATDSCGGPVSCAIVGVSSDEPIDGTGDGDTAPDWVVTGAVAVDLRAERAGGGDGRRYTLTVRCRDEAGNAADAAATVVVPKSQGS